MEQQKTLKEYCKEAKKRLKNGFWQRYREGLEVELEKAKNAGVSTSVVKEYYTQQITNVVKKNNDDNDEFYIKVKKLLDEEGEVSNAIGRLTDKSVYEQLDYEEQQRYTLSLSEKYLKAVERYRKEKSFSSQA